MGPVEIMTLLILAAAVSGFVSIVSIFFGNSTVYWFAACLAWGILAILAAMVLGESLGYQLH